MPIAPSLIKNHTSRGYFNSPDYQQYLASLGLFWNGQTDKTVDYVSKLIVEDTQHDFLFPLYRLWLEQLAATHDHAALRLLVEHFFAMALADSEDITWVALRGLGHLELDDWEACELLAPSLLEANDNPYCLEFRRRYLLRKGDGGNFLNLILPADDTFLIDFFHWQDFAQGLLINRQEDELFELLGHIGSLFPDSPLEGFYKSHLYIEKGEYSLAARWSKKLKRDYPEQTEYQFLYGYINLHLGFFDEAIAALQASLRLKGGANDADVYAMLGYCYREKSEHSVESSDWRRSLRYLHRAKNLYKKNGLPSSETNALYALQWHYDAQQKTQVLRSELRQQAFATWLVNLSPRRSYELAVLDDEMVEVLFRPLGNKVQSDDLVFFVADDTGNKQKSRVLALYHALGSPFWHPGLGKVTALKLIKKFSEPLSVSLKFDEMEKAQGKARYKKCLAGTYFLGEKNFDVIRQAVRELVAAGESWEFDRYFAKSS